jgi:hypothetical protein
MDDFDDGRLIANPAMVLVSLGAIVGLAAASYWAKVARSVDTSGETVKGPDKRDMASAAALSAIALFLACGGFLLGRFTGEF